MDTSTLNGNRMSDLNRVLVYEGIVDTLDILYLSLKDQYSIKFTEFAKTAEYQWVENNAVQVGFDTDDVSVPFGRLLTIYADLTDKQYVDFLLRFDYDTHKYPNDCIDI